MDAKSHHYYVVGAHNQSTFLKPTGKLLDLTNQPVIMTATLGKTSYALCLACICWSKLASCQIVHKFTAYLFAKAELFAESFWTADFWHIVNDDDQLQTLGA